MAREDCGPELGLLADEPAEDQPGLRVSKSYASTGHALDEAFLDDAATDTAIFSFTAHNDRDTAKKYLVCFCEVDDEDHQDETSPCTEAAYPIASPDSLFLHVKLIDSDFEPPEGIFRNQRFSALVDTSLTLKVEGVSMDADHWGPVAFSSATTASPCTGVTGDVNPSSTEVNLITYAVTSPDEAGVYSVCIREAKVGELTVTARAHVGWTYIFDPNLDGSVEITGEGLDWQQDRIMLVDCASTCGLASPSQDVFVGGAAQSLGRANAFVAKNPELDAVVVEEVDAGSPAAARTYDTLTDRYCRAGNLALDELAEEDRGHQCYAKCADCEQLGNCPAECEGYSPEHDGMNSQALCLSETACRDLCSQHDNCFGIDMYKYASRCYLNLEGDPKSGCKFQYETNSLGSTSAYDFLAKGAAEATPEAKTMASGVSSDKILRFGPVGFNADAGKYKVCFCDSKLLGDRTQCLAEKDYSLEVGELYVSGVSCLLADAKFRRGTCYSMYHGGLACSDDITYPTVGELPATSGLPTSWASIAL